MEIIIYLILFMIVLSVLGTLFTILWPFIIFAIICGVLYTVYSRYQYKKRVMEAIKVQMEFEEKFETPRKDLEVIDAEYKERS